jgi:transcriptional regulator with XRE-family HTH domain
LFDLGKVKEVSMSFGCYISEARKKVGLSLRELGERIEKKDGTRMSPQYMYDIESGRRNPPTDYRLKQLADELKVSHEYLQFLAGAYPRDLQELSPQPAPERVEAAFQAFRQIVKASAKAPSETRS